GDLILSGSERNRGDVHGLVSRCGVTERRPGARLAILDFRENSLMPSAITRRAAVAAIIGSGVAGVTPANATAQVGALAPGFTLTDSNGRKVDLASFRG